MALRFHRVFAADGSSCVAVSAGVHAFIAHVNAGGGYVTGGVAASLWLWGGVGVATCSPQIPALCCCRRR